MFFLPPKKAKPVLRRPPVPAPREGGVLGKGKAPSRRGLKVNVYDLNVIGYDR